MQADATASRMEAQAKADQAAAGIEAQWAERRQNEEISAGQSAARERLREAKLIQSKLVASAGASGGASDQSVMDIWKGIEEQGFSNASKEEAGAAQRAAGIKYQSDLGLWRADANQQIAKASASNARLGGNIGAAGQVVGAIGQGMSTYYNIKAPKGATGGTGYAYG